MNEWISLHLFLHINTHDTRCMFMMNLMFQSVQRSWMKKAINYVDIVWKSSQFVREKRTLIGLNHIT